MLSHEPECVVGSDGTKMWYVNGKHHRTDAPAVEWANGTKFWYLNGMRHRVAGPAVERADGTKFWFVNGKRHRTDGPAIEYADGTKEWWIDDKEIDHFMHWYLMNKQYLTDGIGSAIIPNIVKNSS